MACDPVVTQSVPRALFHRLLTDLAADHPGLNPDTVGDTGTDVSGAVTIAWDYSEPTQTLTVTYEHLAWYMPCSAANAEILAAIAKARSETA